jgi:hypothetical protein
MRNGIRQQLIERVQGISDRVFEPHAAGADTEKPYVVISQGVDTEESQWAGFRRVIEIWPCLSRSSFTRVDITAKEVISAVDKQVITDPDTGEVFTCIYLGTAGPDVVDEEWDAITRGLRFAVLALQPAMEEEIYDNDPWVEAMAVFTESTLEGWNVYRNHWPTGYARPAILWRVENIGMRDAGSARIEVTKTLVGHVLGETPNHQLQGVAGVMELLASNVKIPVNIQERRYMTVRQANSNIKADAITAGQVSLVVSRLTRKPQEEFAVMNHIYARRELLS